MPRSAGIKFVMEGRAGRGLVHSPPAWAGRRGPPSGTRSAELKRQRKPALVLHDPGDAVGLIDVKLARRLAIQAQARPPTGQKPIDHEGRRQANP